MVEKLKIYEVFDEQGQLKLIRYGGVGDGGYVVPTKAFEMADVLLGYGVANDISFEEKFSDIYHKPSFGFDCGTETIEIRNKLCTFVRECIASDSFIQSDQVSSQKITTFNEQLEKLNLHGKKLFIKMDIEGAEYDAFKEIYKHSENITGIVMELHFGGLDRLIQATYLLSRLEKDYYLVHVHANNCEMNRFTTKYSTGEIAKVLELTFVNKSLVQKAVVARDQSHPTNLDAPNCVDIEEVKFNILSDKLPS